MQLEDLRGKAVVSIPEAGALLGYGRAASYDLEARGGLPTIRLSGRRKVVPVGALLRLLCLDNEEGALSDPSSNSATEFPSTPPRAERESYEQPLTAS